MTSTTDPEFWTILKTPPKTPIERIEDEMAQILREEIDKEILMNIIKVANENR